MNDINIAFWKATSKKGTEYYRGSETEIEGKKYRVSLFVNSDKKTDKSPDMTLKLSEIKSEKDKEDVQVPKNTKTEYESEKSDVVLTDEDLPF